ncbi:hypothetical protein A0H81_14837 [Grifola frondosa]|uniref:Uncharacterized protein n=1 Tax=Grifola frondosa TaxID=5627 RepID=A0A1C7LLS9_GRIFR|nr:hypothetical protein A0H81_14837 [Grifola frondosa]
MSGRAASLHRVFSGVLCQSQLTALPPLTPPKKKSLTTYMITTIAQTFAVVLRNAFAIKVSSRPKRGPGSPLWRSARMKIYHGW